MLVSVNLFNNTFKVYFLFIIVPHCKVENCALTKLIMDGCFKQLFSYKGFHHVWRIALNQQSRMLELTPTGCM